MNDLRGRIEERASELGFDAFGVAVADSTSYFSQFLQWIDAGYYGGMDYLAREPERRSDPRKILPEARRAIVLGVNYNTRDSHVEVESTAARGRVSCYAWGEDYHRVITKRLKQLCLFIREIAGPDCSARYYVDTGPLLERDIAARTGVGWTGKHGNLVSGKFGSWLFLSVILTSLELEPDPPAADRCGTCTACLEACPTQAFVKPYVLDARRCISYLTIEHRGDISEEFREKMGAWVYGCDICLRACPWNRHEKSGQDSPFTAREFWKAPKIADLLRLTPEAFLEKTRRSAIRRAKWAGMLRNACIAAGE